MDADYGEMAAKIAEVLARLNSQQSDRARIEELERRMCDLSAAMAGAGGKLENFRTEQAGELMLVHEMMSNLEERLESIDRNTSRSESAKRTWRIALVAAIPGVLSIVLRIAEMLS